jgi:hypothetical protein
MWRKFCHRSLTRRNRNTRPLELRSVAGRQYGNYPRWPEKPAAGSSFFVWNKRSPFTTVGTGLGRGVHFEITECRDECIGGSAASPNRSLSTYETACDTRAVYGAQAPRTRCFRLHGVALISSGRTIYPFVFFSLRPVISGSRPGTDFRNDFCDNIIFALSMILVNLLVF